jgi:hypothetical protein
LGGHTVPRLIEPAVMILALQSVPPSRIFGGRHFVIGHLS